MKLAALVVLGACGGKASPAEPAEPWTCDVSDDAKAAAVYETLLGGHLNLERTCVVQSETFVGWVKIGPVASEIGCAFEHAIYDCGMVTDRSPARAMAAAGYAAADPARRVELIVAWIEEIEGELVLRYDEHGDITAAGQTFTAPTLEDGVFTYWRVFYGQFPEGTFYRKIARPVREDGAPGEPRDLVVLDVHST